MMDDIGENQPHVGLVFLFRVDDYYHCATFVESF